MTTEVSFISIQHSLVVEQLAEWANCQYAYGGTLGLRDRIVADYLRDHLCRLGQPSQPNAACLPIHVHRLRAMVRRQLSSLTEWFTDENVPLWEDSDGEIARSEFNEIDLRILETLKLLGEVAHCGRGYYLPTSTRVILLNSGASLLIGGLCTRTLVQTIGVDVEWAGFGRILPPGEQLPVDIPRQSLSRWMGQARTSLSDWTDRLLREAQKRLLPAGSAAENLVYEIYDPYSRSYQSQRWVSPMEWQRDDLLSGDLWLCRTGEQPRSYWLAPLVRTSAGLSFGGVADLAREKYRLLMYGLDKRAGRNVRAHVSRSDDSGTLLLNLHSWPTEGLLRLLMALAYRRMHQTTDGQYRAFPLLFEFAKAQWCDVSEAVKWLGIEVVESTTQEL